ncbi:MAG: hypothetical protein KAW91_01125, partial [candidate division Zixibacteria bacterium]|nr:hypothetical protein [candidate division Zixibacteria bacterium]
MASRINVRLQVSLPNADDDPTALPTPGKSMKKEAGFGYVPASSLIPNEVIRIYPDSDAISPTSITLDRSRRISNLS